MLLLLSKKNTTTDHKLQLTEKSKKNKFKQILYILVNI